MRRTLPLIAAWLLLTMPLGAADETGTAFVARLRSNLQAGNRRAVAQMFRYPLRVNAPLPYPIPLDNASWTLQMFDLLFTPDMRCAIESAQVPQAGRPAPKYPLLVNGGALTLGGGLIVAERTGGLFRITRFSVVGTPGGEKPGVPAQQRSLNMKYSGTSRQAGTLSGSSFDRYLVSLTAGTLLQGRLERFRGLDAVFRVTDLKGVPIDPKADGKRVWAAQVPATGQYRVDIVRQAAFCDPALTYLLTLTVK